MDAIAEYHVKEYNKTTLGWGGSTRSAVKNISEGVSWNQATEVDYFGQGSGNGVVMKMLPLALFCISKKLAYRDMVKKLWEFTSMTHTSVVAQQATFSHYSAIKESYESKDKFDSLSFITKIYNELIKYNSFAFYSIDKEEDLTTQYDRIINRIELADNNTSEFRQVIGKGGCYVYESIPVVHALFCVSPNKFNCVINAVNYGGDTDSNASMVGGLYGLVNGDKDIPESLIKNLKEKDRVIDTANKFWEVING
jgi:ADP-ribosylglycohydrolase